MSTTLPVLSSRTTTLDRRGPVDEVLRPETEGLIAEGLAPSTWRAYTRDMVTIAEWCSNQGVEPVSATPTTVANYIAAHVDDLAPSTIARRVAMWSWWHQARGVATPTGDVVVRQALRGLGRRETTVREAAPLTSTELGPILDSTPDDTLVGLRDRALLTVGLALGRRRSELVALDVEDLQWVDRPSGYSVRIRRSKTDQEGEGETVWLPRTGRSTCPVTALEAWLARAGVVSGPLFRSLNRYGVVKGRLSDRSVSTIIRAAALRAGLPGDRWSGHSLRAGFVTDHARRGSSTRAIARQTGHSPSSPVIHRYVRDMAPWEDNAAAVEGWL